MTSPDSSGTNSSYLASEENFKIVQDMQRRNLIVPVVGDFAGDKALRRIEEYLKDRDAPVTAFYASNVERYLFAQPVNRSIGLDPGEAWKRFYANVAARRPIRILGAPSSMSRLPVCCGAWASSGSRRGAASRFGRRLLPAAGPAAALHEGLVLRKDSTVTCWSCGRDVQKVRKSEYLNATAGTER